MLTVGDVMSPDVRTVRPDDTVDRLRDVLYLHGIGSALVVDAERRPVGIVTTTDIVEDWAPDQVVAAVMSDEIVTVPSTTPVTVAARLMLERRVHHLVVGTEQDVRGVTSSFDLLEQLTELAEAATAAHTPVHTVEPGDEVMLGSPGRGGRRGTVVEVGSGRGLPPYRVRWHDDADAEPEELRVVTRVGVPLDGCER